MKIKYPALEKILEKHSLNGAAYPALAHVLYQCERTKVLSWTINDIQKAFKGMDDSIRKLELELAKKAEDIGSSYSLKEQMTKIRQNQYQLSLRLDKLFGFKF